MFKFDLKDGYHHINKFLPRIFVEYWKSYIFCFYTFDQSDFIQSRFCLEILFILLVHYWCKDSMFFGWWSELSRILIWSNSQFTFSTRNFAKVRLFCEWWETNLRETQEVMTELRIVLNLRTKTFSH